MSFVVLFNIQHDGRTFATFDPFDVMRIEYVITNCSTLPSFGIVSVRKSNLLKCPCGKIGQKLNGILSSFHCCF